MSEEEKEKTVEEFNKWMKIEYPNGITIESEPLSWTEIQNSNFKEELVNLKLDYLIEELNKKNRIHKLLQKKYKGK